MSKMETTDIVIHKGEKDAKYHLYVEDYVISYLKNYGAEDNGSIFFYGKREQQNKKYRIYGAGRQSHISFFAEYDLLDEITCRVTTGMPIFYMRESSGTYELSGFYIFYQSNEAMQSYMIERRKETEADEKAKKDGKVQNAPIHQGMPEIHRKTLSGAQSAPKEKNRLMGAQLMAVFVVLIAIVINSTNSFEKLQELNQAAVEVFFAIENQEAGMEETMQVNGAADETAAGETSVEVEVQPEENVLRLEDLDAMFEEENQMAKQESGEAGETIEDGAETNTDTPGNVETTVGEAAEPEEKEVAAIEEIAPSEQAFARNFAEYYQIEKGDTLYTISIKIYGDTSKVKEICELNQITDPDKIKYGQKILLP